jgi:Domain of unknown function (DUF4412)
MRLPFPLVALLCAAGLARADIVIVQNVAGAGQTGQMTVKVGGDKVRTDVSPQISTITDTATGAITTLMHAERAYVVISAARARAMIEAATKAVQQGGASPSASPPPPKATGRKDKINGYNAAEYTFSNGNMTATYWISTEFPNATAVSDALAKLRKGGLVEMTRAFAPDLSTLPGVPVKTEVNFNGQKIVTELVSATEETVDPTEYQVPAAYTEMKMPGADSQ